MAVHQRKWKDLINVKQFLFQSEEFYLHQDI